MMSDLLKTLTVLLLCCWTHLTQAADEPPTAGAVVTPAAIPLVNTWMPPAPAANSDWDWIQLTSGEWLKGELRGLERDVLDFDSDNLGLLQLDWEDIQYIMSANPMAVMFGDDNMAVGYLTTEQGELVVLGPNLHIPFYAVIGLAKGTPNERDLWHGDLSITFNVRTGNIEQQDFNSAVSLRRRTAQSSFRINYLGHYSRYDSEENSNDHRASVTYDFRLNRDWFFRPVSVEYFRDPFQNIDYQITVGTGLGLYVIDDSRVSWIVTAGPGYQRTRYVSVADSGLTSDSGIVFLATDYEHELTDSVDLSGSYQVTYGNDDVGRAKHHAQFAVDVDLTDKLDLTVALYWDRIEKPQPDDQGVTPKQDDAQLAVGLTLEL